MALAHSLLICRLLSSINSKQDLHYFSNNLRLDLTERSFQDRKTLQRLCILLILDRMTSLLGFGQLKATIPDIVSHFASAVRNIYQQGGRTFWVHNTGPFGCLPVNMFYMGTPDPGYLDKYGCVKAQNEMAMEFNRKLKDTVINLRKELTQAAITYVDVYAAKYEMMSNPTRLDSLHRNSIC